MAQKFLNVPIGSAKWFAVCGLYVVTALGQEQSDDVAQTNKALPSLAEVRATGVLGSSFRNYQPRAAKIETPQANPAVFRKQIEPILRKACVQCHGADTQEGNIRIDTLDPDLLHGADVDWWLEVVAVLTNGEMPPADEGELSDADRSLVLEWLSSEIQTASALRRDASGHSSFRRLTRYEYNYALQDLLGLPYNFAEDLPPETPSDDGFTNSSEVLQMSAMQFAYYRELGRNALQKAVVRGERPEPIYWSISMEEAASRTQGKTAAGAKKRKKKQVDIDPGQLKRDLVKPTVSLKTTHFKNLMTGDAAKTSWRYRGARHAWLPTETRPDVPAVSPGVVIIPVKQKFIMELGDSVPDTGILRVRIRAARTSVEDNSIPGLQLNFGWQASNNSSASVRISTDEIAIDAAPDDPQFYEWNISLSEINQRNPMRKTGEMGETPSPSEYLQLQNTALSRGDIQIDYVEVAAPVYEQWPPASHTKIFTSSIFRTAEPRYARQVLPQFMSRAWRRPVTTLEVDQKVALFERFRTECDDDQEAMIEVLSAVLASPHFLYLTRMDAVHNTADGKRPSLTEFELASRLSFFLWNSLPDEELLLLAKTGQLTDPDVLSRQTARMLRDARSQRFSKHFVRQWLGMQLLDFLDVDKKVYPQFDSSLKQAMQEEPVVFFQEVLTNDNSVLDFLHADYAMVNERLARHYGMKDVYGNQFRKVKLNSEDSRGGLLTQAGLLAMNSDGKDSHPLKRGIWLLESVLNDPPPPPPPAVPEIDLADPEIAKLTLKERIENHRDDAACMSCHSKIDPWGIAFENFDAVGSWRTKVQGQPVDASSLLFNGQELNGVDGLKRFLLANRQDQFARAMVHKMTTFALGRPLTFTDRSGVDQITADLRRQGDGLATLAKLIVTSELFRSK